jgi:putative oxidoreductase
MNRNKANDVGLLALRIFLAAILIFYGSQKMFGAFGGQGISGTLAAFQKDNHFPQWLTMLAIISEFLGSIAVIVGLLTRLAAFGIMCTMATAAYSMFTSKNSYMAAHLPLALCGMAITLALTGAGQYSLDSYLVKRGKKPRGPLKSTPA